MQLAILCLQPKKVFVRFSKSLLGEDMLNCHSQITPARIIYRFGDPLSANSHSLLYFKTITAQQFGQLIIGSMLILLGNFRVIQLRLQFPPGAQSCKSLHPPPSLYPSPCPPRTLGPATVTLSHNFSGERANRRFAKLPATKQRTNGHRRPANNWVNPPPPSLHFICSSSQCYC